MKTRGGDKLGMLLLEGEIKVHHDLRNDIRAHLSVQDRVGWHGYALTQMVGHMDSVFEKASHIRLTQEALTCIGPAERRSATPEKVSDSYQIMKTARHRRSMEWDFIARQRERTVAKQCVCAKAVRRAKGTTDHHRPPTKVPKATVSSFPTLFPIIIKVRVCGIEKL